MTTAKSLSTEQKSRFETEGYLIVPDIFVPDDLEPVRQELDALIRTTARTLHATGVVPALHEEAGFDRQLAHIRAESPDAATAVLKALTGNGGGGHTGKAMFDLIRHPKLLAAVESLVGPEIVGSSVYRVRPKLPGLASGVVPWHQDSGYMAVHCDRHLIVTCWVPLVDADEANGCMRILPRAHRAGIVTHYTGGPAGFLVIDDQDLPLPPDRSVPAPCPRGGVIFMWNSTPHCSTPNHTDHIRWSVDLRYQAAAVPSNVGLVPDPAATTLQPGFEVACYAPEADFVVQSREHPERETTFAEFVDRRTRYEAAARAGAVTYPRRGWTPVAKAAG
jgi:hypothetical protein